MLFLLLTRVLLWIFISVIIYFILLRWIPRPYLTWIGGLFLFVLLVMGFLDPNDRLVSAAWEILSFPLKPLGLSLLLLSIAVTGIKKNNISKSSVYQLWAALIILTIFSLPIVAYSLAQQAELEAILVEQRLRQLCEIPCPAPLTPLAAQNVNTVVVLGQGTTEENLPYRPYFQLNATGDRIFYASQLYWEDAYEPNRPLIIVSAGPRPGLENNPSPGTEADDIKELLIRLGVDPDNVIVERTGTDIRSSAVAVKQILEQRGLGDRVALVTSALNIRRATLTFSNVGIDVIPRPTDFLAYRPDTAPKRTPRVSDFIADAEALATSTRVLEEYYTFIFYFLRGWLSPTIL